jgi:hypothetical protein
MLQKAHKKKHGSYPDLAVGLEGGLEWNCKKRSMMGTAKIPCGWCMRPMDVYGKWIIVLLVNLAVVLIDSKYYID